MTIANMGAELTLTTSVFPADEVTRSYLTRLGREATGARPADDDATYDDQIELDLVHRAARRAAGLARPVVPVDEVAGTAIEQVMVGLVHQRLVARHGAVADVVRGERVHPTVSFVLFPGSHRILETMAREGLLADLIAAGATVSEPTCGACAGIGHVPAAGAKSLRAFNRNFSGRSGVKDDEVYLCSSLRPRPPRSPASSPIPRTLGAAAAVTLPDRFAASTVGFVPPDGRATSCAGPTSSRCRSASRWRRRSRRRCCSSSATRSPPTTSRPPGAAVLVFRSNVPAIAEFTFR